MPPKEIPKRTSNQPVALQSLMPAYVPGMRSQQVKQAIEDRKLSRRPSDKSYVAIPIAPTPDNSSSKSRRTPSIISPQDVVINMPGTKNYVEKPKPIKTQAHLATLKYVCDKFAIPYSYNDIVKANISNRDIAALAQLVYADENSSVCFETNTRTPRWAYENSLNVLSGIGNVGIGTANVVKNEFNYRAKKERTDNFGKFSPEYQQAKQNLSPEEIKRIFTHGYATLATEGKANSKIHNQFYASLKPGYLLTALHKDSNGYVRSYNHHTDLMLQILAKKGVDLSNEVGSTDVPILFKQFDSDTFSEKVFEPFVAAFTKESVAVSDPYKTNGDKGFREFETKEPIGYMAAKKILRRERISSSVKIDGKTVNEFLDSQPMPIYSNNAKVQAKLEQAMRDNPQIKRDILAHKIIKFSTGEQIDLAEIAGIMAVACGIGAGGENIGHVIRHGIHHVFEGKGFVLDQIIGNMISGVPSTAAIYILDLFENIMNGLAINTAELQKRGIPKITGEAVFGDQYTNLAPSQKVGMWIKLTKGNKDIAKGPIGATVANTLNSAFKGAGGGALLSYIAICILSRDYTHESNDIFLAVNMIATLMLVTGTALSIPNELENIYDRTKGVVNEAFNSKTFDISSKSNNKVDKKDASGNKIAQTYTGLKNVIGIAFNTKQFADQDASMKARMAQAYDKLSNDDITEEEFLKELSSIQELMVKYQSKVSITTSAGAKSSIKAFMSIWSMMLIWLLHDKTGKGKFKFSDKVIRLAMMMVVAPFENLWRMLHLSADQLTLDMRFDELLSGVWQGDLDDKPVSEAFIDNKLAGFIPDKLFETVGLDASKWNDYNVMNLAFSGIVAGTGYTKTGIHGIGFGAKAVVKSAPVAYYATVGSLVDKNSRQKYKQAREAIPTFKTYIDKPDKTIDFSGLAQALAEGDTKGLSQDDARKDFFRKIREQGADKYANTDNMV